MSTAAQNHIHRIITGLGNCMIEIHKVIAYDPPLNEIFDDTKQKWQLKGCQ